MDALLKPLLTSAQIPAGMTKPVKVPIGTKTKLSLTTPLEPGMEGSVIFNDRNNHYNIDYNVLPLVITGLDFPCEEGCFFNHSIGTIDVTVIVSEFSDVDEVPDFFELEEPLDVSPHMPAGQTKPVKIPGGKRIQINEEPPGTVGQLLLHHVEPPEIIDYPRIEPTDTVYNFLNDTCIMTNMGPAGTSIMVLAVD